MGIDNPVWTGPLSMVSSIIRNVIENLCPRCSNCGLVILDETLTRSPEWRAFTLEKKRSQRRVGAPTDYSHFNKGLSTTIWVNRDAFGYPLPPKVKRQMWRLRRWQIRSEISTSNDRNLMQAMNELERLSGKLHISPPTQETAAIIYCKALTARLIRGRSIAAIVAAANVTEVTIRNRKRELMKKLKLH